MDKSEIMEALGKKKKNGKHKVQSHSDEEKKRKNKCDVCALLSMLTE